MVKLATFYLSISKNYGCSTFDGLTIIYEVGDETDRQSIKAADRAFADEMMHTLQGDKPRDQAYR